MWLHAAAADTVQDSPLAATSEISPMSKEWLGPIDRRNAMKILGVSGLVGVTGYVGGSATAQGHEDDGDEGESMFEQIPAIALPVIDAYYNGEKVWFLHTSASTQEMADRLAEMINAPVLHVPTLAEIVTLDELGPIYVFRNGVDRSEAEPWGGGPFGFQIDIFDSVPGDEAYTPLRRPHIVTWADDASPRILKSVEELRDAEDAGEVTIEPTDVVVNAPVVDWPDGSLGTLHMTMGHGDMQGMMGQHDHGHAPKDGNNSSQTGDHSMCDDGSS